MVFPFGKSLFLHYYCRRKGGRATYTCNKHQNISFILDILPFYTSLVNSIKN